MVTPGLVSLVLLVAFAVWLPPTPASALEISPHGEIYYHRGLYFSETICLLRIDDECVSEDFSQTFDWAASSELLFETSGSPAYEGAPAAYHQGEITSTAMRGSGWITIDPLPVELDGFVTVESKFEYGFEIDEAADFHLTGLVERPTLDEVVLHGGGFVRFQLCAFTINGCGSGSIFSVWLVDDPPFEIVVDELGSLASGQYLLQVVAGSQAAREGEASWGFELELTPVPEPSQLALLAAGVCGLALLGRQARGRTLLDP
jgi:hypothetical protein